MKVFLLFVFSTSFLLSHISAQDIKAEKSGKLNSPLPLNQVQYWAYQIQEINYSGAADSLVASAYDMVVLEPTRTDWSSDDKYFDTAELVNQLKNSYAHDGVNRKLVIAYIDIGEAEDWRWYWNWSTSWDCQPPLPLDWPQYIISCDPDGWSGNYPVAFWNADWQDLTIWGENQNSLPIGNYTSIIDETIVDGFDGIYLDWVEAFEDESVIKAAEIVGKDPAVEMINFIQKMRDYASIRNPEFLIIQQNASSLIDKHPELLNIIDGIAQEAIWYDGDADVNWDNNDGYDYINSSDLTQYYIEYLDRYIDGGLPVFTCEYAVNYADLAYERSYDKGYIPYVTRRSLSKLTTTQPIGYGLVGQIDQTNFGVPKISKLEQNYPNPFNPSTIINYEIPFRTEELYSAEELVTLKVYNILGKEIATLVNINQPPGNYQVEFDGSGQAGGVYFYQLTAGNYMDTKTMVFLK